MRVPCIRLAALLLLCAASGSPAIAADDPVRIEAGAYRSVSFVEVPEPASITVDVYDDTPDNVALAHAIERELGATGIMSSSGPPLGLAISLRTVWITPEEDDKGPRTPAGIMRADLVDRTNNQVIWEAEAVFEPAKGDIPGGAMKLVPLFVDTFGQDVQLETLDLY